ncbi:hypothetical protein BH24BAC1_BH24BAC1_15530 [soil metagenome]
MAFMAISLLFYFFYLEGVLPGVKDIQDMNLLLHYPVDDFVVPFAHGTVIAGLSFQIRLC